MNILNCGKDLGMEQEYSPEQRSVSYYRNPSRNKFLVAYTRLYKSPCRSAGLSVITLLFRPLELKGEQI